ncbi:MAG: cell division protein FtsX [Minisyncoccia bacterium]
MFTYLKRIFRTFWQSVIRNKSLFFACVLMMTFSLLIFTSTVIFRNVSFRLIGFLKNKMDLSLYFEKDMPEEDILKIRDELLAYPAIKDIEYISQEEALNIFKERNKNNNNLQKLLEELGENPLSASLNIKAKDTQKYQEIISYIENSPIKEKLVNINLAENQKVIERINRLTLAFQLISILVISVLVILSVIITFNTIRMAIYSLRQEIEIMKLVGASLWFIRGPFLIQGIFQGLIASIISLIIIIPLILWLGPKIENFAPEISISVYFWANFWYLFGLQTLFGLILGLVSSYLAINKYLKI